LVLSSVVFSGSGYSAGVSSTFFSSFDEGVSSASSGVTTSSLVSTGASVSLTTAGAVSSSSAFYCFNNIFSKLDTFLFSSSSSLLLSWSSFIKLAEPAGVGSLLVFLISSGFLSGASKKRSKSALISQLKISLARNGNLSNVIGGSRNTCDRGCERRPLQALL